MPYKVLEIEKESEGESGRAKSPEYALEVGCNKFCTKS